MTASTGLPAGTIMRILRGCVRDSTISASDGDGGHLRLAGPLLRGGGGLLRIEVEAGDREASAFHVQSQVLSHDAEPDDSDVVPSCCLQSPTEVRTCASAGSSDGIGRLRAPDLQ